eukprot:5330521-Amphidinium_carterae.1
MRRRLYRFGIYGIGQPLQAHLYSLKGAVEDTVCVLCIDRNRLDPKGSAKPEREHRQAQVQAVQQMWRLI